MIGTIRTIRNLRAEADVKPATKVTINLQTESSREKQILTTGEVYIKDLAKVESWSFGDEETQLAATNQNQVQKINWRLVFKIVGVIYLLRLALIVADAIYIIPLFGKFIEIIGFGFSSWFVVNNLFNASARKRFFKQVFGAAQQLEIAEKTHQT